MKLHSRGSANKHYNSAADKLKKKQHKKVKGSLLTQTALSNSRKIDRLKGDTEVRYMTKHIASEQSSWNGQQMICYPDCTGCSNQLAGLSIQTPGTPGTPPGTFNYIPIVMRPLRNYHISQPSASEGARLGEYINMKWFNIKGSVSAYSSAFNGTSSNGTIYTNRPMIQQVRIIVALDTSPPNYDQSNTTVYQPDSCPGRIFSMKSLNTAYGPDPITTARGLEILRSGGKPPFGVQKADGTNDLWDQSYYENNFIQSEKFKDKRFKILKVFTVEVQQENAFNAPNTLRSVKNFSHTLKLPYKFHYNSRTDSLPSDKQIIVFVQSNVKQCIGAADIQAPIALPKVHIQCKVAFTDP